jgi:fluoride exporter
MTLLFVSLAGGVGAASRLLVETVLHRRWASSFPFATVLVNVTGSFVLGLLAGLVLLHGSAADVRTIGGAGFCGGYTTFSAASFETVRLAQRRQVLSAAANGVGTLVLAVSAAAAGLVLAGG